MQGGDLSACSGMPRNRQNASVVSENLNHESTLSQDQENETTLLQFVHSIICEEHNDLEQLNSGTEVLQFSENTATGEKKKALKMSAQLGFLQRKMISCSL
jgi:hypothetical protein